MFIEKAEYDGVFVRFRVQKRHVEKNLRGASDFLRRNPEIFFCTSRPILAGSSWIPSLSPLKLLQKTRGSKVRRLNEIKDQYEAFLERVWKGHQAEKSWIFASPQLPKNLPWKKPVIGSLAEMHHPLFPSPPFYGCRKTKLSIIPHLSACPMKWFFSRLRVCGKLYGSVLCSWAAAQRLHFFLFYLSLVCTWWVRARATKPPLPSPFARMCLMADLKSFLISRTPLPNNADPYLHLWDTTCHQRRLKKKWSWNISGQNETAVVPLTVSSI